MEEKNEKTFDACYETLIKYFGLENKDQIFKLRGSTVSFGNNIFTSINSFMIEEKIEIVEILKEKKFLGNSYIHIEDPYLKMLIDLNLLSSESRGFGVLTYGATNFVKLVIKVRPKAITYSFEDNLDNSFLSDYSGPLLMKVYL